MNEHIQIEAGRTISSQVYAHLRAQIIENRLTPNTRLSEAGLCEQYGVSRQPVREVLLRLSGDRLIQVHPQRGSFVSPVSVNLFHAAQLIREAVEVEVIGRVAATVSGTVLDRIYAELSLQQTFCDHSDARRFYESDEALHSLISGATGLPTLWAEILEHKIHLDRVRHMSLSQGEEMPHLIEDHRAIFEALSARDPDRAKAAIRSHLRRVLGRIGGLRTAHPEWFAE